MIENIKCLSEIQDHLPDFVQKKIKICLLIQNKFIVKITALFYINQVAENLELALKR